MRVAVELGKFPHEVEELPFREGMEIAALWANDEEHLEEERKAREKANRLSSQTPKHRVVHPKGNRKARKPL